MKFPKNISSPKCVVLLVGTNDMAQHILMERAAGSLGYLLSNVEKKFPDSKVESAYDLIRSFKWICVPT